MTRVRKLIAWNIVFAVFATGLFLPGSAGAANTGNVNFFLGQKWLEEKDWAPLEEQPEFAVDVTFGGAEWPVLIAIYGSGSTKEETAIFDFGGGTLIGATIEATTGELGFGVNKTFDTQSRFYPYISGGLAFTNAELKATALGVSASEDQSAMGIWLAGGGFWRLGSRFNLGGMIRFSSAEADFSGFDVQTGGTHLGVTLGWGWPATPHR